MKNKLHPGAKWQFRFGTYWLGVIGFFMVAWLMGVFLQSSISNSLTLLFTVIFIYITFIIVITEVIAQMSYDRWLYEFTPTNLTIERGIIWKRYSNIPYQRVQNVDIKRGIIARIFGFSSVLVQTAGYSAANSPNALAEGYIPAVNMEDAEKIRTFLMHKISKSHGQGM